MAKSLISTLADNLSHFDFAAMDATLAELQFLRDHKDQVKALQAYEGTYTHELEIDQTLANSYKDGQMRLVKVSTRALKADCLFRTLTTCTEYDYFTWPLVASTFVNYMAKIRDSYTDPAIYGNTERWLIWATGPGGKLIKLEAVGKLSALHMNFPDELTALIARDAGVFAADFQIPLLVYRIGKVNGKVTQLRK